MKIDFPDGVGIFETLKSIDGQVIALDLHLARARKSAKQLSIEFPTDAVIHQEIIRALNAYAIIKGIGRLRLVFPGDSEILAVHEGFRMWDRPARITRIDAPIDIEAKCCGIKVLPYREQLEIISQANELGFDEAIRLNTRGEVCEGAVSNILFRIDDQWVTPELASGCLPGIVRGLLISWFGINERKVEVADLERCDAAFLLSSLKEAQPVGYLEQRPLEIVTDLAQKIREKMTTLSVGW